MSLDGFDGEKKNDGFKSPKPNHPWVGWAGLGCQTTGKMVRVMRFQFFQTHSRFRVPQLDRFIVSSRGNPF